ncbi:MAG TPA: hypothetical protein PK109_02115 [Candidatus Paceibacterota bacterium]|nr:hypothetical protein [Candidatus Paceibacterota bacterium]
MTEGFKEQANGSVETSEQYDFPLLEKVAEHYRSLPHEVGETYLVCCQHLLEPQKHMFEKLISFGFDPLKIRILGKIYSTNEEIQTELSEMGINAIQPSFTGASFDNEHQENCREMINEIPNDSPVILLDDGGQLITESVVSGKRILFAVEQTSSGYRKLEGKEIPFPVLNVARSTTKLVQESPFIARHACERMKTYFIENGLPKPTILIVGLGPIGEAVQQYFVREGFSVSGVDSKHGHTDLVATINAQKPDIVIGATGSNILTPEEMEKISVDSAVHFISVSSSDREFPVVAYREGQMPAHGDVRYKNFTFVNNGFPITFKGYKNEAYPKEMEKTMSLLSGAVMHGATASTLQNGLIDLPEELEKLVNE